VAAGPVSSYPAAIERALAAFMRLPGVGRRTAERMVQHLLRAEPELPASLAEAVAELGRVITGCARCGFYAERREGGEPPLCALCADPRRDASTICVVERPQDVVQIEGAGFYRGRYHVLGGRISPLDGVGPEDLRIAELVEAAAGGQVCEVILAVAGDLEGETTARYLGECLMAAAGPALRVTRIAQGIPVGSGLEFADPATIQRALGRRQAMD